jgi:hypothetical protein
MTLWESKLMSLCPYFLESKIMILDSDYLLFNPGEPMDFIKDKPRELIWAQAKRRITLRRSTLIYGLFGSGKSRLLNEFKAQYGGDIINCCSNVTQILGEMAGIAEPFAWHKQRYINLIKKKKGVYLLDEGQELPVALFVHIKAFIDAGCVFIVTSKAHNEDGEAINELERKMRLNRHEDVLERFLRLEIRDVMLQALEDFMLGYGMDTDSVLDILTECTSTRTIADVFDECVLVAQERGIKVDADVVKTILNGDPL